TTIDALANARPDTACRFARYDAKTDPEGVDRRLYCASPSFANVTFELEPQDWKGKPGDIAVDKLASRAIDHIVSISPGKASTTPRVPELPRLAPPPDGMDSHQATLCQNGDAVACVADAHS